MYDVNHVGDSNYPDYPFNSFDYKVVIPEPSLDGRVHYTQGVTQVDIQEDLTVTSPYTLHTFIGATQERVVVNALFFFKGDVDGNGVRNLADTDITSLVPGDYTLYINPWHDYLRTEGVDYQIDYVLPNGTEITGIQITID